LEACCCWRCCWGSSCAANARTKLRRRSSGWVVVEVKGRLTARVASGPQHSCTLMPMQSPQDHKVCGWMTDGIHTRACAQGQQPTELTGHTGTNINQSKADVPIGIQYGVPPGCNHKQPTPAQDSMHRWGMARHPHTTPVSTAGAPGPCPRCIDIQCAPPLAGLGQGVGSCGLLSAGGLSSHA
jgi:hypothetical protein